MNLYLWDAGTDSGITYMSQKSSTVPQDRIKQITSKYPLDPDSPFYDTQVKPFARLTVTRQKKYEKSCSSSNEPDIVPALPTDESKRKYIYHEPLDLALELPLVSCKWPTMRFWSII